MGAVEVVVAVRRAVGSGMYLTPMRAELEVDATGAGATLAAGVGRTGGWVDEGAAEGLRIDPVVTPGRTCVAVDWLIAEACASVGSMHQEDLGGNRTGRLIDGASPALRTSPCLPASSLRFFAGSPSTTALGRTGLPLGTSELAMAMDEAEGVGPGAEGPAVPSRSLRLRSSLAGAKSAWRAWEAASPARRRSSFSWALRSFSTCSCAVSSMKRTRRRSDGTHLLRSGGGELQALDLGLAALYARAKRL
jgi:hypothetical protein